MGCQKLPSRFLGFNRINAETTVPVRFNALQRMVHNITAHNGMCSAGIYVDANVAGCVPGARNKVDPVIDFVIILYE